MHWDHIGGLRHYSDFCAHAAELGWLNGGFPQSMETVRGFVVTGCDLPEGFDADKYELFQGAPARLLWDGDVIDLGGRRIEAVHTPGHSPGHLCFYERERGYLFTGDLVYEGELYAFYPSTDPEAYLASVEKISALPVGRVPARPLFARRRARANNRNTRRPAGASPRPASSGTARACTTSAAGR